MEKYRRISTSQVGTILASWGDRGLAWVAWQADEGGSPVVLDPAELAPTDDTPANAPTDADT